MSPSIEPVRNKVCEQCHRENPTGSDYCMYCGWQFANPGKAPRKTASKNVFLLMLIGGIMLLGFGVWQVVLSMRPENSPQPSATRPETPIQTGTAPVSGNRSSTLEPTLQTSRTPVVESTKNTRALVGLPANLPKIQPGNALKLVPLTQLGMSAYQAGAWSPDGKWLAVATQSSVNIYRADTLEAVTQIESQGGPVQYIEFSPDSKLFALAPACCVVDILNVSTWRSIQMINISVQIWPLRPFRLRNDSIFALSLNSNSNYILTRYELTNKDKSVAQFDFPSGGQLQWGELDGETGILNASNQTAAFFSLQGKKAFSLPQTCQPVSLIPGTYELLCLIYQKETDSVDLRKIDLRQTDNSTSLSQRVPFSLLTALPIIDAKYAAFIDTVGDLFILDLSGGKEIQKIQDLDRHASPLFLSPGRFQLSPDGTKLVYPGGVYSIKDGNHILLWPSLQSPITEMEFDPGSRRLLASSEYGNFGLWSLDNAAPTMKLFPKQGVGTTFDDKTGIPLVFNVGGEIQQWDVNTGKANLLRKLNTGLSRVIQNGRYALLTFSAGIGEVYDVQADQPLSALNAQLKTFNKGSSVQKWMIAVSPNRKLTGLSTDRGEVYLLNTQTGKELFHLAKNQTGAVANPWITFSNDSNLVLAHTPETSLIWDVNSGKQVAANFGDIAVFSPDNQVIASASVYDHSFRLTLTSWPDQKVINHSELELDGAPTQMIFSPDGSILAIGMKDGTITLFGIDTTREDYSCNGFPVMQAPTDKSSVDTLRPVFQVEGIKNSAVTSVHLGYWIASDPKHKMGGDMQLNKAGNYVFNFIGVQLEPGMDYFWTVRAKCGDEYGPEGSIWSFTTPANPALPSIPRLISPSNGASITVAEATISWEQVPNANQYWVCMSDQNASEQCFNTGFLKYEFAKKAKPGMQYTWWIRAENKYGFGKESEHWLLTVR